MPSVEQEAARDLVRAREDSRRDLMSARHRVSQMLLRQGIVYSGGNAWTKVHDTWLCAQHFDAPGLQLAYDSAYDAMVAALDRRAHLAAAMGALAENRGSPPGGAPAPGAGGVPTPTARRGGGGSGDRDRLTGRSIGA